MAGKQAGAQPYIEERSQGINGRATPADLETALQLTYAYITEPRVDTAVFHSMIERSNAQLANRSDDPQAVFGDSVSAILSKKEVL